MISTLQGCHMGVISLPRIAIPPDLDVPFGRWHGRLWVSDEPVEDAGSYQRCLAGATHLGLWPVLIPPDERFTLAGEDWVDRPENSPPGDVEVNRRDAGAVLREWWPGECCKPECLQPVGETFPGLVRRSSRRGDPEEAAGWVAQIAVARSGTRLGLVRAARSADVPAALGWSGAVNHSPDVAGLSAVLRSWEDRFGTRLVGMGFDELVLSVAAPPTTAARATGVAAEHRAFCPDGFRLQPGTLQDVARELLSRCIWRFWWD